MAIVGFEVDQVRRTPEGDVPVPINMAYNHHCTFSRFMVRTNMFGEFGRFFQHIECFGA